MKKSGPKPLKHASKVPVTMKDNNGQAFTIMIDSSALNNGEAVTCEFAGLASDPLSSASIDEVKYEGWLATEEEFTTSIDWADNNTPVNKDTFAVTPLNQSQCTTISLNNHPFYVDTGAMVHITLDRSDFLTLCAISPHHVQGIGGSSISAIGMGDIKLCLRCLYCLMRCTLHSQCNSPPDLSQLTCERL
ncbi:hypothetical protein L208DRAFT_1513825 [Tricholoma matsutake]|nr:hypothetical protein L208DRAFT_1513825 [Tricholoma matsutake 945]